MDTETKNKHKDIAMTDGQGRLDALLGDKVKNWQEEMDNVEISPSLYLKDETTLPNYVIFKLDRISDGVGKNGETAYTGVLLETSVANGSIKDENGKYQDVPVKAGESVTVWGTTLIDKHLNKESAIGNTFMIRFIEKVKSKNNRSYWKVLVKNVSEEPEVQKLLQSLINA